MGTKFKRHLVLVFRNKSPIYISKARGKNKCLKTTREQELDFPRPGHLPPLVWGQDLLPMAAGGPESAFAARHEQVRAAWT